MTEALPEYLTTIQACERSGKRRLTIQNWIQAGYLPTQPKFKGKGHVILASDLEACLAGKPGRKTPKRPWVINALKKAKERYRQKKAANG